MAIICCTVMNCGWYGKVWLQLLDKLHVYVSQGFDYYEPERSPIRELVTAGVIYYQSHYATGVANAPAMLLIVYIYIGVRFDQYLL